MRRLAICSTLIALSGISGGTPEPIDQQADSPGPDRIATEAAHDGQFPVGFRRATESVHRGLNWLRGAADQPGGWMRGHRTAPTDASGVLLGPVETAVTAMGVKAFVQAGIEPGHDPVLDTALRSVLEKRLADGRFDDGSLSTYITATVISTLVVLDDPALSDTIADAVDALKALQWNEAGEIDPNDDRYGGFGYGTRGRPDLSNTQLAIDALNAACVGPEDETMTRALVFLTRTQNLPATNEAPWAIDDGGFIYTPAGGGESMASEAAGEGRYGESMDAGRSRSLRSYGSMTYAGFKSLLHAGLARDDPRVVAALAWIGAHWTFDENPGVGQQGWFYYVHAMARALRAYGEPIIVDAHGVPHDWRAELTEAVVARQASDGSWRNTTGRWLEDRPELATIYAVLALEESLMP